MCQSASCPFRQRGHLRVPYTEVLDLALYSQDYYWAQAVINPLSDYVTANFLYEHSKWGNFTQGLIVGL